MIPISQEQRLKLNYFATAEGSAALEHLSDLLFGYFAAQCSIGEGNQLYRDQGAAQLAKWLKQLPQGLRNGSNAPTTAGS